MYYTLTNNTVMKYTRTFLFQYIQNIDRTGDTKILLLQIGLSTIQHAMHQWHESWDKKMAHMPTFEPSDNKSWEKKWHTYLPLKLATVHNFGMFMLKVSTILITDYVPTNELVDLA